MAESNEDENNDVQMKEICVIPIDQPGQKSDRFQKRSLFLSLHTANVAAQRNRPSRKRTHPAWANRPAGQNSLDRASNRKKRPAYPVGRFSYSLV